MRRRSLTLATAAAALLAAGCGFSADRDVRDITSDDLFGLDQTTTTSSTTTTSTTTTTIPPTVVPSESSTSTSTSVTPTTVIVTQPVELFFLDGMELAPVSQNLAGNVSLPRVLDALESGPPSGDAGIGLQTALPRNIVNTVTASGGVAAVDLVGEAYERIEPEDEGPAIAQIVLTLTRQSGIGQVRFTLDGEPLPVRLGSGLVSRPGEPVSGDDYAVLLGGEAAVGSVPPETTDPTETTQSSEPPPASEVAPAIDPPAPPTTG